MTHTNPCDTTAGFLLLSVIINAISIPCLFYLLGVRETLEKNRKDHTE